MINLAYTSEELQEKKTDYESPVADLPKYPWGLTLNLDEMTIKKLGREFKTGEVVTFQAQAKVVGQHSREEADGDTKNSVELQLIAMDFGANEDKQEKLASSMYGENL